MYFYHGMPSGATERLVSILGGQYWLRNPFALVVNPARTLIFNFFYSGFNTKGNATCLNIKIIEPSMRLENPYYDRDNDFRVDGKLDIVEANRLLLTRRCCL
jgi:hypothetical protein